MHTSDEEKENALLRDENIGESDAASVEAHASDSSAAPCADINGQISKQCQMLSRPAHTLINTSMCVLCYTIEEFRGEAGGKPRRDNSGHQLCEACGIRLDKVKYTFPSGAGRRCHPRCKPKKGPDHAAAAPPLEPAVAPVQSMKKRKETPAEGTVAQTLASGADRRIYITCVAY
jgi:hypothetical protein